jgi:PIN domain nuclease of toxin-antitoxin system
LIYLDTHIVVWLYAGLVDKLSPLGQSLINQQVLSISPIVRLELKYLYEIQRIRALPETIIADLQSRLGLIVCNRDFNDVVTQAMTIEWTRDPFDRLITAQSMLEDQILLTKDQTILANYSQARWD